MKEKPVETLDLKNGLKLNIYDASRKLAGDRWRVSLIARMEIPVSEVLGKNDPEPTAPVKEIKDVLGARIVFEQKRQRIFVDANEKENVFNEMYDSFIGNSLDYLSKETFPKQFILKTFKEKMKAASFLRTGKNTV
jgi:hypothetical protein